MSFSTIDSVSSPFLPALHLIRWSTFPLPFQSIHFTLLNQAPSCVAYLNSDPSLLNNYTFTSGNFSLIRGGGSFDGVSDDDAADEDEDQDATSQ